MGSMLTPWPEVSRTHDRVDEVGEGADVLPRDLHGLSRNSHWD